MQYSSKEISNYIYNYLAIKSQIQEKEERKKTLLKDKKLKETVEFYESLDDREKKTFLSINCNNLFIQYILNNIIIIALNKALANIYKDFKDSDMYPFTKDKFHFFIKDKEKIVCALTNEDSSNFTQIENEFLEEVISFDSFNIPSLYTSNDKNKIKALYCKYKDGNNSNLEEIIALKFKKAKQFRRVQYE